MVKKGYDGYRGRSRAQNVARAVTGIVLFLLVLVVGALVLGQRYIVYTDNGIQLEVPFLQEEEKAQTDVGDVSVQIVHKPQPVPQTPVVQEPYLMRAVSMSVEQLEADGATALTDLGANTVVLDMKDQTGKLAYDGREEQVRELLELLHRADLYAVARVVCFRDDTMGRREGYSLLTNSGYLWNYDDVGLCWMDPGQAQARQYVAAVVKTLAQLGFDEILLEEHGYPTQGELGWIRKNGDRAAALNDFAQLAQQAVEGTQTVLSIAVDGTVSQESLPEWQEGRIWLQGDVEPDDRWASDRVVWPVAAYSEDARHLYLDP